MGEPLTITGHHEKDRGDTLMPARKIVDETEVLRWFEEGRTYEWMRQEYLRKYDIEMGVSAWGNFRRRHGLERRIVHDVDLIPWEVKPEHRWGWAINMLRTEARRRAGRTLSKVMEEKLNAWLRGLEEEGTVVHYDPDTLEGWFYVPRREGIDTDIIRVPERATARKNSD